MSIESSRSFEKKDVIKQVGLSEVLKKHQPRSNYRGINFYDPLSSYSLSKVEEKKMRSASEIYAIDHNLGNLAVKKRDITKKIRAMELWISEMQTKENYQKLVEKKKTEGSSLPEQEVNKMIAEKKKEYTSALKEKKRELQQIERQLQSHPKYKEYQELEKKYEEEMQELLNKFVAFFASWRENSVVDLPE